MIDIPPGLTPPPEGYADWLKWMALACCLVWRRRHVIDEAVQRIRDGSITDVAYDPKTARLS